MFVVSIDGVKVECETPSDALNLIQAWKGSQDTVLQPAATEVRTGRQAAGHPTTVKFDDLTLRALYSVRDHKDGIWSADLVQKLGLPNGPALGTVAVRLGKYAKVLGMDFRDIVSVNRNGKKSKWSPGKKLEDVLANYQSAMRPAA